MRVLSLFAGIGGFDLGLERAGFQTVAFCEIDPFARRVLARHWPEVPCYDDVRTLTAERLGADGIAVDVICGGFPCQDISTAGRGVGITGERSGLWREFARLIGEIRPRYVLVENVAALLSRGLGDVLGDLAALGFDAEWHCIPASAVGAPHRRDRVWIMAYAANDIRRPFAGSVGARESREGSEVQGWRLRSRHGGTGYDGLAAGCENVADAHREPPIRPAITRIECDPWQLEPGVGRVVDGLPGRVDRLRALGNAVVPQVVELIGRAIMSESRKRSGRNP
jgi:DNA (cytosine-5)-methyltransferase 1